MGQKYLPVSVAIVGVGGVGSAVVKLLSSPALSHKFRIVALVNSKLALIEPNGIPSLPEGTTPSDYINTVASSKPYDLTSLLDEVITLKGVTILVDNTSSSALALQYPSILRGGVHIATPNKKAWSSEQTLWDAIRRAEDETDSLCLGESSVGAGLPVIGFLKDLLVAGDEVLVAEGVLSGTLSYVLSQFSPVVPVNDKPTFSSIIRRAKELELTEPDPRDDLSGADVARKLTILARHINFPSALQAGHASVPTQSLVPDILAGYESKEEYLTNLEKGDEFFEQLRKQAEEQGKLLRYVGTVDCVKGTISAGLQLLDSTHPFVLAPLGNALQFHTRFSGPNPIVIQGGGASSDITALGVVADCIRINERRAERSICSDEMVKMMF